MQDAGRMAGLDVLRSLSQPNAALIGYGLDERENESNFLVFHLGGGTLEVCLVNVERGIMDVFGCSTDERLGGSVLDERLMAFVVQQYKDKTGKEARIDGKLRENVEEGKKRLSWQQAVEIEVEESVVVEVSRAQFEELCKDVFEKAVDAVRDVLAGTNVSKNEIVEVVLSGGTSRVPKLQQLLRDFFDGKEFMCSSNPEEMIATGLANFSKLFRNACSGHLPLPDICPLSLGVELGGGIVLSIIERNSMIPLKKTKSLVGLSNEEGRVLVSVFEGERFMTKDNQLLGVVELNGLPPSPHKMRELSVSFELDVNARLHVSVVDEFSGMSTTKVIEPHDNRSREEIDRLLEEAVKFAEKDKALLDEWKAMSDEALANAKE